MDSAFLDPFNRLLGEISTPAVVRNVGEGGDATNIWQIIQESGFADALVSEASGGAGLSLSDVVPLVLAAGEHLLPVPFAETMVARALIADCGAEAPVDRPIMLWPSMPDGRLRSQVGLTHVGEGYILVQKAEELALFPAVHDRQRDAFGVLTCSPDFGAPAALHLTANDVNLMDWSAAITAAYMAGAMRKLLAMSLGYVNERQQFGRSLGKFQAIQHQLSVMAEKVVAANVAARMGFLGTARAVHSLRAATAKYMANDAANMVSSIAHAVHGAIGISAEYDLQLYTRRLKRWQLAFGSASYWAQKIGAGRLAMTEGTSVDFIRRHMAEDTQD